MAPRSARPRLRRRMGDRALVLLLLGGLLASTVLLHATLTRLDAWERVQDTRELAGELSLTDLALFTEARHARHPAMADHFTAFQNHPMALEHFPTGALIRPPRHLHE